MSEKGLKELEKQGLLGGDKIEILQFCEHCIYEKAQRVKFPRESTTQGDYAVHPLGSLGTIHHSFS